MVKGERGPPGVPGSPGGRGTPGPPGRDGLSGTEIWANCSHLFEPTRSSVVGRTPTGSSIKRSFVASCTQANQVNLEIQAWRVLLGSVDHLAGRETSDLLVSLVSETEQQI